jgi:hypothetical protein
MKKYEIEALINSLKRVITESDEKWNNKVSHTEIIGFLQGSIKGVIDILEEKNENTRS